MKTIRFIILLIPALISGLAFGQAKDKIPSFNYVPNPVMLFKVDSTFDRPGINIKRITYTSADSFTVSAFITEPKVKKGRQPLVVFCHWAEGNKTEFLEEAIGYSAKGMVCILLDAPWLCPGSKYTSFTTQGYELYRQNVLNVRTAIDLAGQQFKIDPAKIIYVGHSFGCNTGAILSAIEKRITFFVFMAGVPSTTESIAKSTRADFVEWRIRDPKIFEDWITKMKPLNAENYLPLKTAPCLVQMATQDEYVSREENERFAKLATDPKEVYYYECTHSLNETARKYREEWVGKRTL